MPSVTQRSFAGGEVAVDIDARSDIDKYPVSVAEMANSFAAVHGPCHNRPGWEFKPGYAKFNPIQNTTRLIPFVFNTTDTYVLEFGVNYMRVIRNGGFVLADEWPITNLTLDTQTVVEASTETLTPNQEFQIVNVNGTIDVNGQRYRRGNERVKTSVISDISQTSTGRITIPPGHFFVTGFVVYLTDIDGALGDMLNNRFVYANFWSATEMDMYELDGVTPISTEFLPAYTSGGIVTHKEFDLKDRFGVAVNGLSFEPYISGGTIQTIYEIATPYTADQVRQLKYAQTANTLRLTHNDHPPKELFRFAHDNWELTTVSFTPQISAPVNPQSSIDSNHNSVNPPYLTITGVTAANPPVVTATINPPATTLENEPLFRITPGTRIAISGVVGMTQLNGKVYIAGATTATTVALKDEAGTDVDAQGYGAYVSGGQLGIELWEYAITAVDGSNGEESLASETSVAGANLGEFGVTTNIPRDEVVVTLSWDPPAGASVENYFVYKRRNGLFGYIGTTKETHFKDDNIGPDLSDNPPDSPVRDPINRAISDSEAAYISGIVLNNPIEITSYRHGFSTGHVVFLEDIIGTTELNDLYFKITVINGDTFTLDGIDGTSGHTAFISGGTAIVRGVSLTNPVSIRCPAHGYGKGDRVIMNGIGGTVELNERKLYLGGTITGDTFELVDGGSFNVNATGSTAYTSGGYASDYPAAVGHFQQRVGYGQRYNERQTLDWTASGLPTSFNRSSVGAGDDAFSFSISSDKVNAIRHIVPDTNAVLFTDGGIWISTSGSDAYTLSNVLNKEQSSIGVSDMRPIKMPSSILFVQESTLAVLDIAYSFEQDKLIPADRTLLAFHLIEERQIVSWAWSEKPYQIVYCVLDDGQMIAMTYNLAHKVWAWHRHPTDGLYEEVCAIREGNEDRVYAVILRTIDGKLNRHIERLHTRVMASVRDAFFVDSGLSYDAPSPINGISQDLGEPDWPIFRVYSDLDVSDNDIIEFDEVKGAVELNFLKYRMVRREGSVLFIASRYMDEGQSIVDISAGSPVITTQNEHGYEKGDSVFIEYVEGATELNDRWFMVDEVPTPTTFSLSEYVFHGWFIGVSAYTAGGRVRRSRAVEPFYDRGRQMVISPYTEGGVIRKCSKTISGMRHLRNRTISALNDGSVETALTVSNKGVVELSTEGARIHMGLPFVSRVKLLPIESPDGQMAGRDVTVTECVFRVKDTVGMWVGQSDDSMYETFKRTDEDHDAPVELYTGLVRVPLEGVQTDGGQVIIEQRDPLPLTVLSVKRVFEASTEDG